MKKLVKISGLILLMLIISNFSLEAQRGMRGMMMDSVRMNRMGRGFGMRGQMWPGPMMGRMWRGPGYGMMMNRMRNGMRPMPGGRMTDQNFRPGIRMFRNIPDLTEKQKKSIDELIQKQQSEMQKFRDEMMTKMKSLRESNRTKIMDLLTPEQKKWVEENTGNPPEK
jgi:hypothetical protein